MIIACTNCNKKFNIDDNLIPKNGRLLQCSSCNHKWFFKNEVIPEIIQTTENTDIEVVEAKNPIKADKSLTIDKNINNNEKKYVSNINVEEKVKLQNNKNKKKSNFINSIFVFLISFAAFIILLDTFKIPISKIFPNINSLLNNFYESIMDLWLFINNLI